MIALMGPPPPDILQKGPYSSTMFDETGNHDGTLVTQDGADAIVGQWRNEIPIPPAQSLDDLEENLTGDNKRAFLRFMGKMIQWRPEDRQTAGQLLKDEWLNSIK